MIKATRLLRHNNAGHIIRYLTGTKADFTIVCSNYTTKIQSDVLEFKFVRNMQSNRTFAAFAKLKKDVSKHEAPQVDRAKVKYYVHNFRQSGFHPVIFNIDLKSAYATILNMDGYISDATFEYLKKLNKNERLAAVGMLATRKNTFYFSNGEPIEDAETEEVSPLSGFFFYAVKRTSEIMDELKKRCGDSYLFTWVDGIYFMPDELGFSDCCQFLDLLKFPYTVDYLKDFEIVVNDVRVTLYFKKNGKVKLFNLPHSTNDFKKTTVQAIQLLNNKKQQNERHKYRRI
jgi:hypothetical protein